MRDNCKDCWDMVPNGHNICKNCSVIRNLDVELFFKMDWNKVCCYDENFINLQESIAWFWDTEKEALHDYVINLHKIEE